MEQRVIRKTVNMRSLNGAQTHRKGAQYACGG